MEVLQNVLHGCEHCAFHLVAVLFGRQHRNLALSLCVGASLSHSAACLRWAFTYIVSWINEEVNLRYLAKK